MKYSNKPVISAPSGLALGGGEEVVLQSNHVVSHTNIVMGLVETIVGLVPAGGGCKELLWRWSQSDKAKNDPDYAPLEVFNIIGYAKTATSPHEAKPLLFLTWSKIENSSFGKSVIKIFFSVVSNSSIDLDGNSPPGISGCAVSK